MYVHACICSMYMCMISKHESQKVGEQTTANTCARNLLSSETQRCFSRIAIPFTARQMMAPPDVRFFESTLV